MTNLTGLLAAPALPRTGLLWLDWVAVAAYLVVTVGIVIWAARRQRGSEEFFLANRNMPWLAVGMSLLATLMSTISYLGSPGEVIKNGLTIATGYLSIPFSMLIVLGVWVPFFMRLNLTSAYDYLERRFSSPVRLVGSFLFLMLRLGWISLVMYTASMALARMTNLPVTWVIPAVGVAATIFACLGGIQAVIWNDVLQFFMLFGGTAVTIGYVWWTLGVGPSGWWQAISAHVPQHTNPPLFSLDPFVRMTIITQIMGNFFWTICTHGSDQVVLQRYFSTTSLRSARRSYLVNTVSDVAMGVLLAMSGLALHAFYLQHSSFLPETLSLKSNADELLPYFFSHQLPVGFGGLILAGFLCDAMQTLESGVNSITAVATRDVVKNLLGWTGERAELRVARGLTLALGIICTGLAINIAQIVTHSNLNIIDLMPRTFNMFLGPLASLFLIGMFLPYCTSRSALVGVCTGLLASFIWSYFPECCRLTAQLVPAWAERATALSKNRLTLTMSIGLPYLVSFCTAAIFGWCFDRGREHPGRIYSWFAVMQRPAEKQHPVPSPH